MSDEYFLKIEGGLSPAPWRHSPFRSDGDYSPELEAPTFPEGSSAGASTVADYPIAPARGPCTASRSLCRPPARFVSSGQGKPELTCA